MGQMLALRALKQQANECKENQRNTALGVGEARVGEGSLTVAWICKDLVSL